MMLHLEKQTNNCIAASFEDTKVLPDQNDVPYIARLIDQ